MNKEELIKNLKDLRDSYPNDDRHTGVRQGLLIAIGAVEQLDEPAVLSQEWIDNNVVHIRGLGEVFEAETVENLLVPKQEFPVIPQFVADWIEKYIEYGYDLYPALKKMENNSRIWKKTYDWYRKNTHKFVNAYLTEEYEVEEKLYYTVDEKGQTILFKCQERGILRSNGIDLEIVLSEYEHAPSNIFQLTEKEIKDYDERYWPFAVEVEE